MGSLNIIFPDQLSLKNEALKTSSNEDLLLFYEPHDSFYEISHHKHKLVFQISALRHLIGSINNKNIKHEKISKKPVKLIEYLSELYKEVPFSTVNVSRPSDFKTLKDLMYFCQSSNVELNIYDDKNFITSPSDYQYWAKDKKSTTQEFYYRWLRKRNNVLMDDAKPVGGSWNYDKENRQGISKLKSSIPERSKITTDQITLEVMIEVQEIFINSYGDLESFNWAVTHQEAFKVFNDFLDKFLLKTTKRIQLNITYEKAKNIISNKNILSKKERDRFLKIVQNLRKLKSGQLNKINIEVKKNKLKRNSKKGIF